MTSDYSRFFRHFSTLFSILLLNCQCSTIMINMSTSSPIDLLDNPGNAFDKDMIGKNRFQWTNWCLFLKQHYFAIFKGFSGWNTELLNRKKAQFIEIRIFQWTKLFKMESGSLQATRPARNSLSWGSPATRPEQSQLRISAYRLSALLPKRR